jgi:hypothetical protein
MKEGEEGVAWRYCGLMLPDASKRCDDSATTSRNVAVESEDAPPPSSCKEGGLIGNSAKFTHLYKAV